MATPGAPAILHQEDVEAVIDARAANKPAVKTTIATPNAPGAAYAQADATSLKTAIDAIRGVLTAAGLTN